MDITASGFDSTANNGRSVVTAVTATTIDVTKATPTVTEAAGSGRRLVADATITVSRATPNIPESLAASRSITAERLLSFVWDRRPPRS
jgi:hypothetical protein